MGVIDQLRELRDFGGAPQTTGLDDAIIERFAASHPSWRRRSARRSNNIARCVPT